MRMVTELCHAENRRMGSDNRIASLSDDRWVAGPREVWCSAKMAGERCGILSSGHRAVAIVATAHGTHVRFSHEVPAVWCMPMAGACRFDADSAGSNHD